MTMTQATTERQARIEFELGKFNLTLLESPMHELQTGVIDSLVSESGYSSSKSFLDDGYAWGKTLRETITDLVNSIYTLDGVLFESLSELQLFSKSK